MSAKEDEIFQAVENKTYKFALQQCSKLIKKSPNVTYYQVLYNYILLESGKKDEAVKSSLEIMSKTPNDIKTLSLLNTIFNKVGKPAEALLIYENAAKKYPNFELLTTWFHLGCDQLNYKILQKAAMALKSFHPSQRLFNLWAGFGYYLCCLNNDCSVMEGKLFPKLGLKIIESLKPFRNEQEVYIYVKLLEMTGLLEQIPTEILDFTGVDNKLDLELQLILLKTFDDLKDFRKLFEWSERVLVDYKIDDFTTWKYLVKSGIEIGESSKTLKIIEEYSPSRNTKLGMIEYNLLANDPDGIIDSIHSYYKSFGDKSCCFYDLKHYMSKVDSLELLQWIEAQPLPAAPMKAMVWELNVTKFKLYLNKDLLHSPEFIDSNIELFNKYKPLLSSKAKTDFFPGDEFILISLQSLLSQSFTITNIIKAIIILENLILKDEHEFHLRLWLIQLYSLINCFTQSKHHYDSLKIKNIQNDILDHYLNSRAGSIQLNNSELSKSMKNYEKLEMESIYFIKIGFNKSILNKLGSMLELTTKITRSSLKRHEILQGLQVGRLLNDDKITDYYSQELEDFQQASRESKIHDNRDFKIFWNFGIDEINPELEPRIFANIPICINKVDELTLIKEKIINGEVIEELPSDLDGLTSVEKWSLKIIHSVSKFLNNENSDVDGLNMIKELYQEMPSLPNEPNWEISHNIATEIDTVKSIQSLISSVYNKKNKHKKLISDLKELNINKLEDLRSSGLWGEKKTQIESKLKNIENKLIDDPHLRKLEISEESLKKIFEIIAFSNYENFKQLRIL